MNRVARSPNVFRASVAFAALATSACSYDLTRLRGHDVSGTDASSDVALDVTIEDGADADDVPIAPDVTDDTPIDAPIVCTSRTAPLVSDIATMVGGTLRVTSDTTGEQSLLTPPRTAGCMFDATSSPAPEKVFRYVVQQGPRLYVNTDAADCAGVFDTVLYARTSCEQSAGEDVDCNDDDHVLQSCSGNARLSSGLLFDNLVPGQTLFLVVDGYGGNAGQFRLNVTENGLLNAAPSIDFNLTPADLCSCPGSLDNQQRAVMFPASGDLMRNSSGSTITALNRGGDRLVGMHSTGFSNVAGTALEFRLAANTLCPGASAIVDLLIGGHATGAFYVDSNARVNAPLRMALQTFRTLTVTATNTQIELRLRSVSNNTCGMMPGLRFDLTMPGTLTLLGRS